MTPYRGRLAGRVAIKCTIPSEGHHSVHRQLGTVGCANVVAATGDAFASAGTTEEREGQLIAGKRDAVPRVRKDVWWGRGDDSAHARWCGNVLLWHQGAQKPPSRCSKVLQEEAAVEIVQF